MKVVGLTGGIGCGKSAVTAILAELGAAIINADAVGHQIYAPGTPGWTAVVAEFGQGIVAADGIIDRPRLGAIVFGDPAALARLNSIVHPLIYAEILARIAAEKSRAVAPALVLEAAILIEAHWTGTVDEVWLVVADREVVEQRLQRDRGLPIEQIQARMRAQLDEASRRGQAQVIIENNGSRADLDQKVRQAWDRLLSA